MYVSLSELMDTSNMKMTDEQIKDGLIRLGFVEDVSWNSSELSSIVVDVSKREQNLEQTKNTVLITSSNNSSLFAA